MAAAAAEETLLPGFRFTPFDRELITHYLKPMVLGQDLPCKFIQERQVYGASSNPWDVFDPNDHGLWFTTPDIKDTEKYMFAFAKLSKISTSNSGGKNTSKKAGCGTWVGKTSRDQIKDDKHNVIGEKRYLKFEIKDVDSAALGGVDLTKVGSFRMHEYSLSGVNSGLGPSADTTVLCKITHDSSEVCQIAKKMGTKSSGKAVKKVKSENLTPIDCGGGDNLDESKTFNSQSLVESNSDISDCPAAPQFNSCVQEVDELVGNFCFDDLDGFSLDDLFFDDTDWMGYLNFQQEEPLEYSTNNKPGKRKFELEENLHQAKKMCLG